MAISTASKLVFSAGFVLFTMAPPSVLAQPSGGGRGVGGGEGGGNGTFYSHPRHTISTPSAFPNTTTSSSSGEGQIISGSSAAPSSSTSTSSANSTERAPPAEGSSTSLTLQQPPPQEGEWGDSSSSREGGPPPGGQEGGSSSAELTAECDFTGLSASYSEFIIGDVRNTASSTGCPNHANWNLHLNPAREIPSEANIPAYPVFIASNGTTDLSRAAGAVGILFNGVSAFSSWARDAATSYETSAFYLESDTFDLCGGHATTEGWYHYHNTAGCVQEQAMVAAGSTRQDHSPQLGWSYDGFPLYGQLGPGGVEMKLCGQSGADATYCLDSCSGYKGELEGVDNFKYRYYTSCGFDESFFPFTTNCYRGCCPGGVECPPLLDACGESPEEGYTAKYTPVAGTSLAEPYESALIIGIDADVDTTQALDCGLFVGSEAAPNTLAPTPSPTAARRLIPTPSPSTHLGGSTSSGYTTMGTTFVPTASPTAVATSAPTVSASGSYGIRDKIAPAGVIGLSKSELNAAAVGTTASTPSFVYLGIVCLSSFSITFLLGWVLL